MLVLETSFVRYAHLKDVFCTFKGLIDMKIYFACYEYLKGVFFKNEDISCLCIESRFPTSAI